MTGYRSVVSPRPVASRPHYAVGNTPPARGRLAIEVRSLTRVFKNGPRAVDAINLEVEPGEIYGFLGPNGAGKSTTILMMTTLLPPTSGTALIGGHDIVREGKKVRAAIGAALQEAGLDPLLSGRDHLRLQAALHSLPRKKRDEQTEHLLDQFGLSEAAGRKVMGYSGGMRRRLDLAMSLIHRPRILFLDEPTTGLDPQSRSAIWAEVRRLARDEGVTVFLTTQYLEEADALADRIGIIDHGAIVAEGTPEALKAEIGRPTVEAVAADATDVCALTGLLKRFGEEVPSRSKGAIAVRLTHGAVDLAGIVRLIDSEGLRIAALNLHEPTLDDVFLAKTGYSLEGSGGSSREPSSDS
jgi:ABC-2 type transport system ATP-binding protein